MKEESNSITCTHITLLHNVTTKRKAGLKGIECLHCSRMLKGWRLIEFPPVTLSSFFK